MKITTAELKRFKNNSSFIKKNNVLPILSYLKFHDGEIIKSSLNSFVVQKTEFKGSFLVDENILFNFLNFTNATEIDISLKDTSIIITDGVTKVSSPTDEVINFPETPSDLETKIEFTNDIMCAISFSSQFVDQLELPDMRSHVFIGDKMIAGCNGFIGYTQKFEQELPKVILSKETANIVGKFNDAMFSQNERFVFFEINDIKYGFIKPTYPYFDMTRITLIQEGCKKFTINKSEIISFSEMCNTSVKEKGIVAGMSIEDGKLNLVMTEAAYKIDINKSVDVVGSMNSTFYFNPAQMSTALKNLPDTELTFHNSASSYHITGESGFIAVIQPLSK